MAAAARLIRRIPCGRVSTYGWIAAAAGDRRGARQVARLLHSSAAALGLPWHRVINLRGRIGLRSRSGYAEQVRRLRAEGVLAAADGAIDLERHGWRPRPPRSRR